MPEKEEVNAQAVLDAIICAPDSLGKYRDALAMLAVLKQRDRVVESAYNRAVREDAKLYVAKLATRSMYADADAAMAVVEAMLELDAACDFDAYMQFMEWDRPPKKRFYQPRRDVLLPVAMDLQDLFDGRIELYSLSTPPRVGKALAFDTKVLTRRGFVNHGDLTIRDEVAGPDGLFHRVLAIHEPCEMQYVVEFTNGEKVTCHGNHEWTLYSRNAGKTVTIETKELAKRSLHSGSMGSRGSRYSYQLESREPLRGCAQQLAVKPYTLGAWLGDGRNNNPDICGAEEDYAIVEGIVADGYGITWKCKHKTTGVMYYGFGMGLRGGLQRYGMCHSKRRTEKHIPDEYLVAPIEDRLELLAGLLDTDGTLVRDEHRYTFSTADEELGKGFEALVSTFGWRVSHTVYEPTTSSSGVRSRRPCHTYSFNPTMPIPCRLERKRLHEFSKQRKVAVKSVEPCDDGSMGNCITVEGGLYCVGSTMVQTHNSTIGCFFMSFSIGNHPEDAHLMTGFSDKLTSSFWYEMLGLITDSDTYRFARVFPDADFVDKNAANETIHLVKRGRFPSLTCRSIGGTLTGAVEVGQRGILYCDDMVEDYEQALSADRMDKLYEAYLSQARDRKLDGAREFHIGTRWVPNDIIGRLEVEYEGDRRMRARRIPALDENGESNFDYQFGLGFSTEYYEEMRRMLCNAGAEDNWSAKYMCSPYWKEGRLYETDDLRFFEELPEGEPDIVMAVCDTKTKGPDYCVQVVDAVYGDDHYIIEVVCDDGLMESIEPRLADQLAACNVSMARYESNVAGGKIARDVEGMCIARGLPIVMKTKYSTENKETRILADSGWVKRKCLFRSAETRGSEYDRFLSQLLSYNVKTKNKHDDVPDAMSMLRRFCDSSLKAKAVAVKRPF